jgi:hypothetical protein
MISISRTPARTFRSVARDTVGGARVPWLPVTLPENSFSLLKRELAIQSARLPPDVRAKRRDIFADNPLDMPFIVEVPVIGRRRTCRQYSSTDNRCARFVSGHNFFLLFSGRVDPGKLNRNKLSSHRYIDPVCHKAPVSKRGALMNVPGEVSCQIRHAITPIDNGGRVASVCLFAGEHQAKCNATVATARVQRHDYESNRRL